MRSKASVKSHPIHPILIAFPIAFFIGTLIFDVLAVIYESGSFAQTALYINIAGVAGAVIAAVPGLIDYLYTVPPKSSAKKRAATHGILNSTNLVIFIVAWILRGDVSEIVIIVMECAGIVLLFIAGWMGGTLVYRNQIGVDPRYAHAGKWKEEYFDNSDFPLQVANADELKVNQMKLVHVKDKRIVIARTEKGYAAFEDRCTHKGGSLAGGSMICSTVQCPWHGSHFDVNNGEVKAGPAKEKIKTYPLKEENGKVLLTSF